MGIPICNFFVRKYCNGIIAGTIQMGETVEVQEESKKRRLLDFKWMAGDNTIIAKMAIVGWLGYLVYLRLRRHSGAVQPDQRQHHVPGYGYYLLRAGLPSGHTPM